MRSGTPVPVCFCQVLMLIYCDVAWPDTCVQGYEASVALRSLHFTAPIIALTANALTEERSKAFKAGMNEFCTKPIRKHEVMSLMRQFCGHQHSQGQAMQVQTHGSVSRQVSSPSPAVSGSASGRGSGAHTPSSALTMAGTQPYASASAASSVNTSPLAPSRPLRLSGPRFISGSAAEVSSGQTTAPALSSPDLPPTGLCRRSATAVPSAAFLPSAAAPIESWSFPAAATPLSQPPMALHTNVDGTCVRRPSLRPANAGAQGDTDLSSLATPTTAVHVRSRSRGALHLSPSSNLDLLQTIAAQQAQGSSVPAAAPNGMAPAEHAAAPTRQDM